MFQKFPIHNMPFNHWMPPVWSRQWRDRIRCHKQEDWSLHWLWGRRWAKVPPRSPREWGKPGESESEANLGPRFRKCFLNLTSDRTRSGWKPPGFFTAPPLTWAMWTMSFLQNRKDQACQNQTLRNYLVVDFSISEFQCVKGNRNELVLDATLLFCC